MFLRLLFILLLVLRKSFEDGCDEPLGLEDGRIKDSQLSASNAFQNDFSTYGPYQARLNKRTWPQGYRSDGNSTWLKVDLDKPMIITSIATQGYGDESVAEWVKEFYLLYADIHGQKFKVASKPKNGIFVANKDRQSVKLNFLAFPVKTKSILVFPKSSHGNAAFRMELYGCEPGYYFVVWVTVRKKTFQLQYMFLEYMFLPVQLQYMYLKVLIYLILLLGFCLLDYYFVVWVMVRKMTFQLQYMFPHVEMYKTLKETILNKVAKRLEKVPGYFSTSLIRFSPKPYKDVSPYLVAELEVYCLKRDQATIYYHIQMLTKEDNFFEPTYLIPNYPLNLDCRPPLIDIGLSKTPYKAVKPPVGRFTKFIVNVKTSSRCNETIQSSNAGCIGTAIEGNGGLFKSFHNFRKKLNKTFSFLRFFGTRKHLIKIAYVMCFSKVYVNNSFHGESYDYGFIQVYKSKIIGKVNGQNFAVKGMKSLIFDAYDTHDTMLAWNKYNDLNISWTLAKSDENAANGSFLTPLLERGVKVEFSITELASDATYNLTMTARREKKHATVRKLVHIFDKPSVYIRCKRNCGPRNKRNESRVFQMSCVGTACDKVHSYQWYLRYENASADRVCDGHFYQHSNLTLELIKFTCPGVGQLELIGVLVFNNSYSTLRIKARISMMIANSSRTCSVFPLTGKVLETDFNISCLGWADGGLLPTYKLFLNTDTGMIDLVSNATSKMIIVLPIGNPKQDYKLNLSVEIQYKDGEEETVLLDVKVHPIKTSKIFEMFMPGSNFTAKFLDLVKNGDINTASTIAISALSIFQRHPYELDKHEDKSVSFMANKVKSGILKNFKNVSLNRVDEVSKLLYVIALCSEQNYEGSNEGFIPQENQINALDILDTTTNFVSEKFDSIPGKTYEQISKVTFSGLGAIIKSASNDAKTGQQDDLSGYRKDFVDIQKKKKMQAKNIITKALKITKKVSNYLSSTLASGEQTAINTPYVGMLILKGNYPVLSNRTISFQNSIVRLPSHEILFAGKSIERHNLLDLKITLWRLNPFTWHFSSNSIKSAIVDVTFTLSKETVQSINSSTNNSSVDSSVDLKINNTRWNTTSNQHINMTENLKETMKHLMYNDLMFLNLSVQIELLIPKYGNDSKKVINNQADGKLFFVKPSTKEKEFLTYHKVYVTSPYINTNVKVKPEKDVQFDLYIRYGERPTSREFNFTKSVPDYSSCYYHPALMKYVNCSYDPFTFSFTSKDSGHIGLHYIGIRYLPQYNNSNNRITRKTTDRLLLRVRKSLEPCIVVGKRQKRSCAEYKKVPLKPAATYIKVLPDYEDVTDIKYTLDIVSATCMFWDIEEQEWSREGCKLGLNSTNETIHCLCDHLTSFGGDFFVAPNPIDYSVVFEAFGSLDESGNTGVLTIVCVILMLFVIGLLLARRYDNIDERKNVNRTIEMESEVNETPHAYKIQIETGIWRGSGTTADVGIIIYGENGCSGPICLTNSNNDDDILFAKGSMNTFNVLLNKALGSLIKIVIWHDNGGNNPSWYLHQVIITDQLNNDKWYFYINRWLAVEKGDGRIGMEVKVFNKNDKNGFRDFFTLRTARGFANDHLWVSVFTRPPHNPFTRCQRLACCMSILFATMITNAMFYQLGSKKDDNKFNIGPIQMSITAIKIGIQSAFIAIPINVIVVMIFKKASNMEDEENTVRQKRFPLSRLMISISWFLCSVVILTSALYVVFYSMQWGKETSNSWLVSVVVSSMQDIFITGPIKVVCIAFLLAVILRTPPKEDDIRYRKNASKTLNTISIKQPEEKELEKTRVYKMQKKELFVVIRKLIRLVLMFVLFMIVCYGNRDRSRFMLTKSVKDVFHKFDKVHHQKEFWKWTRTVLVPGLFDSQWYNNQSFRYKEGFISNREAFLVGMPRIRQFRIKPVEKCPVYDKFHSIADTFSRCLPSFSAAHEDRGPYYMPNWKTIANISLYNTKSELEAICPKHWRYQSANSDNILQIMGNSYASGGYVAELGYNSNFALKTIQDLEKHKWLDDFTVAVFIEFTLFEPASSLLCVVKYTYKKFLHGKALTNMEVKALVIYPPSDSKTKAFMRVSQIALLVYIIILIVFELRTVYLQRCKYFRNIWNWFEMFLLVLCTMAMVMMSFVQYHASNFVEDVGKNPYKTWATDDLIFYSELEVGLFGSILFILTIKTLKLVSFNRPVLVMMLSLKDASKPLMSFSIVFFTTVAAFAILANVAFGASMSAYSSLQSSFLEIIQVGSFGGDLGFKELYGISPFLGPLYMFFLRVCVTFILINMFIAILNFSYGVSNAEMKASKTLKNIVILNFGKFYFKTMFLTDIKNFLKNLWYTIIYKLTALKIEVYSSLKTTKKQERQSKIKKMQRKYDFTNFNVEGSSDEENSSFTISTESKYCKKHKKVETRRQRQPHRVLKSNILLNCIRDLCGNSETGLEEGISEGELQKTIQFAPEEEGEPSQGENLKCRNFTSGDSLQSLYRTADKLATLEDEAKRLSVHSDSTLDCYDDIEFIDEDYVIADIKKSLSEIRLSIAGSFQSLSSKPSRSHSTILTQNKNTQSFCSSSPSGSLLYSTTTSRSEMSLPQSRSSIGNQSLHEADSEWSFSSGYYRIEGSEDYR